MPRILGMIPIETAVWVILVLIGVISSIVSSARKAAKAVRAANVPRRPVAPQTIVQPGIVAQAMTLAPEPPSMVAEAPLPPPVIAPRPVITPRAVPPKPVTAHGTPAFRGMFERGSLVRAIVAAEVLGPPKALQEQSIWSPRHSEPSI